MSAGFVQLQPDSTGKKVQTYENTVGSDAVEAQAVTIIDPTGWSDSYVQVEPDDTGKKAQTFLNTISGNAVHALAVRLVDSTGAPV